MFTRLRSLFDNVFTYIFFPTRRIRHKLDSWRSYYICLCKPAFFVSGLVYAHKFVNYAVVLVLITYFTDTWKNNLLKAVAIVNVQEGLSAVLEIFMTNVSVGCLRLRVILYSTAAYIIGLLLFCLSAFQVIPLDNFELLYILIVIPIAVGNAGGLPILEQYLADQLRAYEPNQDKDEDRVEARRKVWCCVAWICAFITYLFIGDSWPRTFLISASVMGIAYLLLLCGIPFYHAIASQQPQRPSPLTIIPRVIKAALLKGHLEYPLIPNQFFKNDGNQLCLSPQIKLFRWLDKAAIIESSSSSPDEQEKAGRLCSVKQVWEMKLLLTMVPMWSAFLGFGLVLSAADTFFLEQWNTMDPKESIFPISILLYLRDIIKSGTSYLCNLVLSKLIPEAQQRHAIIVRIWAGLVLTIFCCCVAWRGEVHRPKITIDQKESGWLAKKKEAEMWRVWLVIQFFLLGIMEGLAKDGLDDFFDDQVSESMKSCGSAFTEFVIGIGSLLNGFCVFICRSWFAGTLNGSRLDKYYQMLTVVSFISLCYYWYVSTTYTSNKGAEEDVKQETATEFAV